MTEPSVVDRLPMEQAPSVHAPSIAYFQAVYQAYQQVEAACSHVATRYFQVANAIVCLRFAGTALVPLLTRAIAHLEVPPVAQPDLVICLASSQDTGYPRPATAWQGYQYQKRGEVRGFVNDRIYTALHWGSGALMMVDHQQNLALYWVDDHASLPYWEIGAPLQAIFNVWLSQRRVQLVHAAAVGFAQGGALLVGKGGSGKSTTALSCLNSDLMYASDDYCLITPDPEPTAFSLYSTGKKNADDLERLPFLKSRISNPDRLDREKAVYFLQEQFPEKILCSFPLKATLIPRVTGKLETTLEATVPNAGIVALVPSTIMQLGGAGKTACDLMTAVLSQLPCYYLNVGTEIPKIATTIQAFLEAQ
jgi:hypothetical protein